MPGALGGYSEGVNIYGMGSSGYPPPPPGYGVPYVPGAPGALMSDVGGRVGGGSPLYSGGDYGVSPNPGGAPLGTPLTVSTERDPNLEQTYGDYRSFRGDLAAGTDRDAVNAMMRQRDLLSGLAKEIGESRALDTGVGSGAAAAAVSDVYTSGGRDLSKLNADLAAGGRSAQLAALGGQAGAAGASAGALQANNSFALATYEAERRAAQNEAELRAARERTAWEQQMQLANLYTG